MIILWVVENYHWFQVKNSPSIITPRWRWHLCNLQSASEPTVQQKSRQDRSQESCDNTGMLLTQWNPSGPHLEHILILEIICSEHIRNILNFCKSCVWGMSLDVSDVHILMGKGRDKHLKCKPTSNSKMAWDQFVQ